MREKAVWERLTRGSLLDLGLEPQGAEEMEGCPDRGSSPCKGRDPEAGENVDGNIQLLLDVWIVPANWYHLI